MELEAFHETKLTTNNYCVKKPIVVVSENEMEQLLADKNGVPKDTTAAIASVKANVKIQLEMVFYDFNISNIRSGEETVLNNNIEKLKANPDLKIRVIAHSDSKGSDKYNRILSERRARAAADYLIKNGISRKRILEVKGQGETSLQNNCTDNVECSDEAHQLNRRTEFIIVD